MSILDIVITSELVLKYREKFSEQLSNPNPNPRITYDSDALSENEMIYRFWLDSILYEYKKFEKMSEATEKYYETKVVLQEYVNMIFYGKPREHDTNDFLFHLLIYANVNVTGAPIFIGSIFYSIQTNGGLFKDMDTENRVIMTGPGESVLFFLSIYKSTINKCTTCPKDNTFAMQILQKLTEIAIVNNCVSMVTEPIGQMKNILEENFFFWGRVKPKRYFYTHYTRSKGGIGKEKRKRNSYTKKKKSQKTRKNKKL